MSAESPEFEKFASEVRRNLLPKIKSSYLVLATFTGTVDVKFAIEIGAAILLDKPIIACVTPGTPIPEKLARVVDRFVEMDITDPTCQERLTDAITNLMEELETKKKGA